MNVKRYRSIFYFFTLLGLVGVLSCVEDGGHATNLEQLFRDYTSRSTSGPVFSASTTDDNDEVLLETLIKEPCPEKAKKNLEFYASIEHMAGTAGDYHLARWTRDKMREFGYYSEISTLRTTLDYPGSRYLKLLGSDGKEVIYKAVLNESSVPDDATSSSSFLRNHSFLAYVKNGNVKSELVYANYGRPEDFDVLEKNAIPVKGKIVIVRYGKCFRGLKIMNAEQRGAIGVIIYSDPQDDGFSLGKVYPEGPWRPKDSVQRGSAQFNSLCIGDPFRSSAKKDCGYDADELIPSIPAIPISYGDAIPFLKSLKGPKAKDVAPAFVGALASEGVEYNLGPSEEVVHLSVHNVRKRRNVWNVISMIKGEFFGTEKDRPIILGNHRDAWIFGAADPNSGSSLMLETARALGKLKLDKGWRPLRTIVFGSWSAEEHGLIGSTGWAELAAHGILKQAAVYINVDVGVSGSEFISSASGSMFDLISSSVAAVKKIGGDEFEWTGNFSALGSGSDYAVFLDNLGIASCDLRFSQGFAGQATSYGTYHSVYDSYHYIQSVIDPDFKYHASLAKIVAVMTFKLSSEEILPLNVHQQALAIESYLDTLTHYGIDEANMGVLKKSALFLTNAAEKFMKSVSDGKYSPEELDQKLGMFERQFLSEKGLPRRKHFKSILQAPGFYLGYAPEVFPGVVQALSEKDAQMLDDQVKEASKRLSIAAEWLEMH